VTATLDDIMEQASQALADLDYPRCESLCLRALAQAREAGDWPGYSRVVLPLQESRRQRRQAALDGRVRLGTAGFVGDASKLMDEAGAGCIVLTPPCSTDDAARLEARAAETQRSAEVLYAQPDPDGKFWTVHSYAGPLIETVRPAPPAELIGRWLPAQSGGPASPSHWFMQASEALGNAAIAACTAPLGDALRVEQLEQAVSAVGDHELLHQALADAARAMQHGGRA
jgi:hypothetical protein